MFTWLYIDHLPHPPEDLIQRALSKVKETAENFRDWEMKSDEWRQASNDILIDGNVVKTRRNQRVEFPEWEQWVSENITRDWIGPPDASSGPGLHVSLTNPEEFSSVHGAHCDNPESWRLMYIIDKGGEGVATKFWRQKGHSTERYGAKKGAGIVCNNFDDLMLLDSAVFPERRWILLNAVVLHSIHGTQGNRSNLNVRIPIGPIKLLKE